MIDPAEHTGLVGHLMGRLQVRKRFQKADADDIEGDMMLALCVAAKNYGEVGKAKFGTYAWSCVRPIAASGSRHHCRFRRRKNTVRGVDITRRAILFSEIGHGFTRSKYFATQPPAEHELEEAEGRACAAAEVDRLLMLIKKRFVQIIHMRYGFGCEPMTYQQIGRRLRLSGNRARQLEVNAVRKLREKADKD